MNLRDTLNDDESFPALLARYGEALREGGDAEPPPADPTFSAELRQRLERTLNGLRRLQVRPRAQPPMPTAAAAVLPPQDATRPDGLIGQWVGRFHLRRLLGHGGGGLVFLAFDTQLRREVALKIPRLESMWIPELQRRFSREGQAAAGLNHPNLAPILETGEVNGICYLVSTYYRGGNLAQWLLERTDPVSVRLAAELVAALADAVQYVHDHGILHRDIKPGNILLDAAGVRPGSELPFVPRLSDFGVAKLCDGQGQSTHSGVLMGTSSYMAPEQVEGRRQAIGPATDVYGLGAVLYELLTGRPPFRGESDAETLRQVRSDEPTPPQRPDLPRDLATICLKCLHKASERRYATAADLAAELRRFLGHEPIIARPPGRLERVRKWMRRRPLSAVLLGGAGLLVLLLFIGALGLDALWQARDTAAALAAHREADREEQSRRAQEQARKEQQQRRRLYVHHLAVAWRLWEDGRLDEVVKEIEGYRPALDGDNAAGAEVRGFEWYYLWRLAHPPRQAIRHPQPLQCLAYSPDSTTCATGHRDGAIRLWHTSSGRLRGERTGHCFAVRAMAYSPDGKWLASGSGIRAEGECRGELFLWDLAAPQAPRILSASLGAINAIAFSPDGQSLVSVGSLGRGGELRLWSVASGAQRSAVPLANESADSVAFAPDGRSAIVGGSAGGKYLYDTAKGTKLGSWSVPDSSVWSVAVVRNGVLAAGSPEGSVRVWRGLPNGGPAHTRPHDVAVRGVSLSADGETVASIDRNGIVKVSEWNSHRQRFTFSLPHADNLGRAVAISPDGQTLAAALEDGRLWLCDVPRTAETQSWLAHRNWLQPCEAWAVAYSPDGQTLASAGDDHAVRLWDAASGKERRTLLGHSSLVTCLAYSPDGKLLASGSYDGTLRLWDAASGRPLASLPHPRSSLRRLAFSPDGTLLASGGKDRIVRLWDVRRRQPVPLPQTTRDATINVVAFAPKGRYLAAGDSGGVLGLWHMDDRRFLRGIRPAGEPACAISDLAFAPDGHSLATVHSQDGSVRLSQGRMWERSMVVGRGKMEATSVAYSPDGKSLVVGYLDGVIRLWHVAARHELLAFHGSRARVNSLALSPNGRTLAAARHDGRIQLWRGASEEDLRLIEQGRGGR